MGVFLDSHESKTEKPEYFWTAMGGSAKPWTAIKPDSGRGSISGQP